MSEEASQALEPVLDDADMDSSNESDPSEDIKEDGAPATDTDENQGEAEKPEKPPAIEKMQKRIDQMRAEKGKVERQLQELMAWREQQEAAAAPKPPREDDFETLAEYQEALVEYRADQKIREVRAKEKEEAQQKEAKEFLEKTHGEYLKRLEKFKAKAPDFDAVAASAVNVLQNDNSTIARAIGEALHRDIEAGPEILYHLGQNPDALDSILSQKSPVKAIYELAKIEQSLSGVVKETKLPSSPVNPVKTRGRSTKTIDDMSPDELLRSIRK